MRNIISMLSHRYLATGGGVQMEVVISFLVAVAAGVACHYIIKWLDGAQRTTNSLAGALPP